MSDTKFPKLIRLSNDGEMTAEQAAELTRLREDESMRAEIDRATDFEQNLQQSVGRVMKRETAPAGLAARVRASISESHSDIGGESVDDDGVLARIFGAPTRANFFAVAACLSLVAGAILFGIFGPTINNPTLESTIDLVSDASVFAGTEHGRCASNESVLAAKTTYKTKAMAQQELNEWLGVPVSIMDLSSAGYEFAGAGRCELPVPERSGHMMYQKKDWPSQPVPKVSVFVIADRGQCRGALCSQPLKWYRAEPNNECPHSVLRISDGTAVYFVVCCVEQDLDRVSSTVVQTITPTKPSG